MDRLHRVTSAAKEKERPSSIWNRALQWHPRCVCGYLYLIVCCTSPPISLCPNPVARVYCLGTCVFYYYFNGWQREPCYVEDRGGGGGWTASQPGRQSASWDHTVPVIRALRLNCWGSVWRGGGGFLIVLPPPLTHPDIYRVIYPWPPPPPNGCSLSATCCRCNYHRP